MVKYYFLAVNKKITLYKRNNVIDIIIEYIYSM